MLCRRHLSAGTGGAAWLCHRGGRVPAPNPQGPWDRGTVAPFLPHLWEAEPCLAEPDAVLKFSSTQSQGKWPKLLCPPHLQPLWLHPVVPGLLAWFKASERGKVCTACTLRLLLVFSGLRAAEQHILSPPSSSCVGLLHAPCARSPKLP